MSNFEDFMIGETVQANSQIRTLLTERDTLKTALGNSEKLYTAVCDELAAKKAENTRLREALITIAAHTQSAQVKFVAEAALAPATPTQETKP